MEKEHSASNGTGDNGSNIPLSFFCIFLQTHFANGILSIKKDEKGDSMKRNRVLYLEVAEKIKADIFSRKYPVGSMLPTESELEALFDVSKITVRKAIELLAADEYVEKKSGRGTTVLSDRPYNKLSKAASFTQILEKSHLFVEKKVLGLNKIQLEKNSPLARFFGEKCIHFQRLYLLETKPYILFDHYLPIDFSDISKEEFEKESLYRLVHRKGYEIQTFSDDFAAVHLSAEQQEILNTTETIAIKRIRKSVDRIGKVVEYSEAVYNTAQHPYHIEYEA